MSGAQALALRRAAVAASALAATAAVHAATAGELRVLPVAPALWGFVVVAALLCGPRAGAFAARGPLRTLGLLLATQAVVHAALIEAPWVLGARPHHELPLVTDRSLLGHVAVALLLSLLIARGERLLLALTRAVEAVRRVIRAPRPRARPAWVRLRALVAAPVLRVLTADTPSRGPPPAV